MYNEAESARSTYGRWQMHSNDPQHSQELIYDYGLYLLDQQLIKHGKRLADYDHMPPPTLRDWGQGAINFLLHEQLNYDQEQLAAKVQDRLRTFNQEEKAVYDAVMQSYNQDLCKTLLIHSAGGGGKTWVCNTIAAAVCSGQHEDHRVALCVASSGIASLLLDGSCTAHSCFKLPIPALDGGKDGDGRR
jgi:hypothetical protein